ncbi:hypothetical protein EYF80_001801 [Liparis tanakae]|uniref:Uncharacterized protein n=1 Tax=Liparis tanakae TaxID=230148 RepID=A0A4Z2JCV8_9TELE|nr:hypothetical protein EYF80_001801 [Liparis tanakae]
MNALKAKHPSTICSSYRACSQPAQCLNSHVYIGPDGGYWRPELPAKALAKGLRMEPIYALCIIRQTPSGEWEGSSGAVNTEGTSPNPHSKE